MAAQLKRRKFTVAEFYCMVPASILGEDTLEELIDGDVMVRAYKTRRYSNVVSDLIRLSILDVAPSLYFNVNCPIRLDDYNEPVADAALSAPDFDSTEHPGPGDLLLVIEVADTPAEVEYDRDIKLPLYARYGITELWLVKLQSGEVEVHRQLMPGGYTDVQRYRRGDTLTIQALPGVRLAVDELLQ
jgi:Uma2 family endonuclease